MRAPGWLEAMRGAAVLREKAGACESCGVAGKACSPSQAL